MMFRSWGIVLHKEMIAMKTVRENLSFNTAAYLNSLNDKSVHIVNVNDYLAKRDSDGGGFKISGLTTDFIVNSLDDERKCFQLI